MIDPANKLKYNLTKHNRIQYIFGFCGYLSAVSRGMEVRFFREAVTVKGILSLKSDYLPKEPCKELRNPGRFV